MNKLVVFEFRLDQKGIALQERKKQFGASLYQKMQTYCYRSFLIPGWRMKISKLSRLKSILLWTFHQRAMLVQALSSTGLLTS